MPINLKALFLPVNFKILIFLFLFLNILPDAQAQCANKIELAKVETTSPDNDLGTIEVNISTRGTFKSQLFRVTGSGKILTQEKFGNGNSKITFSSLKADDNYQVLVIFESEEKNSCAKRQISEISTLKNQI